MRKIILIIIVSVIISIAYMITIQAMEAMQQGASIYSIQIHKQNRQIEEARNQ
jgi:uncharacterized protein YxeA